MTWQIRTVLAGLLAALGVYVVVNPVRVTTLVAGVIPWLLLAAGVIYLLGVVLRKRRRPITMVLPALVGVLLVYAGLSMRSPPMRKFSRLRWVCAPHSRSAGTSIGPKLSVSVRVAAIGGTSSVDASRARAKENRPGLAAGRLLAV